MTYHISQLSLSVAYIALTISIQTFMPSILKASDRHVIYEENKKDFFTKKYAFSTPLLDANKLTYALLTSKDESEKSRLFSILETEGAKEDKNAQEKLYTFYTRPLAGGKFNNNEKAEKLLQFGLGHKQGWAYWEQAEKIKKSPYEVVKEHFLAANLSHPNAEKYLIENYQDDWALSLSKLIATPTKQQKKSKNFISRKINEIEVFRDKYIEQNYALPLIQLYESINHMTYLPSDKILYWSIVKGAADLEFSPAMDSYGSEQYHQGNSSLAFEYFQKAANLENIQSIYNVAVLLAKGFDDQKPNELLALPFFKRAADLGHSGAMYNVGLCLENGLGEKKPNPALALLYYEQGAKLGFILAMNKAGTLLYKGFWDTKSDKKRALQFFKQSADFGNPDDMYNTGTILEQGFEGQKSDKRLALCYYEKAAKLGHAESMGRAGILLERGFKGQKSDKKRALEFFKQAAALGDSEAMHNAATLLTKDFIKQDPDRKLVKQYLQQASNKKFSPSMVGLAVLYLESDKDNIENLNSALFWLEKAHALNNKQALYYLNFAQGYLNQNNTNIEENDSQLEELLKETKNCVVMESQSSSFDDKITLKNQEEESNDSDEEKETSVSPSENKTGNEEERNDLKVSKEKEEPDFNHKLVYEKGNIKQIRANLRQMASLKKEREQTQGQTSLKLSPDAQKIVTAIKNNEAKNLNNNDLRTLFKDSAFQNQVQMTQTKSGLLISAHNRTSNQHISTSTHRKHTGAYKGMNPAFVKDLKDILEIFPDITK